MADPKHDERVHMVCEYLKRLTGDDVSRSPMCKECPRYVKGPYDGKYVRGCRSLAEEVMSLVIHGTTRPPGWDPDETKVASL